LAKSLHLFEVDFVIARPQREDVRRLRHPSLLVEKLDLLVAQAVDIESPSRHEVLEMLHHLIWAGEFAAAARDGAFLAGGGLLAYHVGLEMARALGRK